MSIRSAATGAERTIQVYDELKLGRYVMFCTTVTVNGSGNGVADTLIMTAEKTRLTTDYAWAAIEVYAIGRGPCVESSDSDQNETDAGVRETAQSFPTKHYISVIYEQTVGKP